MRKGILFRPVGGPEADLVFRFLLAAVLAWLALIWLPEVPHMLLHSLEGPGHPRRVSCRSNLRQIGLAARAYAADNDGRLWPRQLRAELPRLLPLSQRVFVCPSDPAAGRRPALVSSYETDGSLAGRLRPRERQPLLWDRRPWHDGGGNVLFCDETIRWLREPAFSETVEAIPKQQIRMELP